MPTSPNPPAAETSLQDDEFLLCPTCGYDLRGTLDDRYSECRTLIDPESHCLQPLHKVTFPPLPIGERKDHSTRSSHMRLSEMLKPQNIKIGLAGKTKSEAISELVNLL